MLTLLLRDDCVPVGVFVELPCRVNAGTRKASHEALVKTRVAIAEENLERMVTLFSRQAAAAAAHLLLCLGDNSYCCCCCCCCCCCPLVVHILGRCEVYLRTGGVPFLGRGTFPGVFPTQLLYNISKIGSKQHNVRT